MKLRQALLLLVVAAIVTAAVTFTVFRYEQSKIPANTKSMPYVFTVAQTAGVDVGTDKFRLGALPPGNGAYRMLHLTDSLATVHNQPRSVSIVARGPGSQWLFIDPSNGTLPIDVNITLRVPLDAPLGVYEGTLLVTTETME